MPGDYTYYQQIPENPENFTINERINLLSSYSGCKEAWLENGVITSDQTDYYIVDHLSMTSKEEIRGDLVDLYTGKVIAADAVIPKGSVFTFYRTDGKSYVDFKLEDGRVIRLIATDYNTGTWKSCSTVSVSPDKETDGRSVTEAGGRIRPEMDILPLSL